MNPTLVQSTVPEYRDRSTGLSIFGSLTVLLGGVCFLMVGLMIVGQLMIPAAARPAQTAQSIGPALLVYGGLAVTLVWLGIGSIMARRWARALLLVFSWSVLVVGVISMGSMSLMMPKIVAAIQASQPAGRPALPTGATTMILTFTLLFLGVFLVVVPGVGILFYRSRHVKATCDVCDPIIRWTDRCPLPVLAVSLWLAASVPMILVMPLAYRSLLPFFGIFLTGWPGTLGYLVLAAVWTWCALAFYRLDIRGWWLLVVLFSLFTLSNILTYSRYDMIEVYRLMDYPEAQIELMKQFSFLNSTLMSWAMGLFLVPLLGYLIFLRKYFPAAPVAPD